MLSDAMPIDHAAFIRQHTELLPVPLIPEIKLHLAYESVPLWQKTEDELGEMGLPPPFWAFAWAGGQALARYVLDHPEIVTGKRVLDLASGSGLVGIAAMKAGAASVLAADIDAFALAAIAMNANANACDIKSTGVDLLNGAPQNFDVILVGDLFYEQQTAVRCLAFLQQSSAEILIGDPGRSYLPKELLISVAQYQVPVSRDLEDSEIKQTSVWRFLSALSTN
jgi:predicted nicotinamide N-methyase